ncbi:MAG: CAP domain-containing protein [Dehalococcoidia bacterium]|nr:MAG: CAP domain-containing protein [Dehalococcoidia bacterium]
MPVRGRVLRRIAMAALAASAVILVPAASRDPVAGAPGHAAQPAHVSSVLGGSRSAARVDRWDAGQTTPRPTNTASPTPSATATMAPPPPPPTAVRASRSTKPAALPPTVAPPPPPPPPASDGGWYDAAFAGRVRDLINVERARVGLGPLSVEPRLTASATAYARVLSDWGRLSHTGPDGSTLVTRAEAAGFPFTVQEGEVLAWGNHGWTPEGVVRAWLNSPPHREEILSPVFTRAGISCYFTPAAGVTVYCVMDLAG